MHFSTQIISVLLTLILLLILAGIAAALARRTKLPFPILLILAGMVIGLLPEQWLQTWVPLIQSPLMSDLVIVILLPLLVFETAQGLDIYLLRENSRAILTLAVPGLLLSAGIMAIIIGTLTPLSWGLALLLGVILSATDPAAVLSIFRRVGAPKDLKVLVEGESLFNDATTIVLTKVILIVLASGAVSIEVVGSGIGMFLFSLLGGAFVGWLFARLAFWVLVRLRHDPFIEITLTLVLAYGAYIGAELLLEASGIAATTVAALMLAKERPLPVDHRVEQQLLDVWSYLSHLATALIFLMVGVWVAPALLFQELDLLLVVIFAMLISRGIIIYGLLPRVGYLRKHGRTVYRGYRHLLFWGGMRGAITLALAMGLSHSIEDGGQLLSIALGAVLFTVLLQGFTMEPLVRRLGLDELDIPDRFEQAEGWLLAKRKAMEEVALLQDSPFGRTGVPEEMAVQLESDLHGLQRQLNHWRQEEEGPVDEWRRLLVRGLSIEISFLHRLFDRGLLSGSTYTNLNKRLKDQLEAIRHDYPRPESVLNPPDRVQLWGQLKNRFMQIFHMQRQPMQFVRRDYEAAWGRRISTEYVIAQLEDLIAIDQVPQVISRDVLQLYTAWRNEATRQIQQLEHHFPELTLAAQRSLVRRMVLTTELVHLERQVADGLLAMGQFDKLEQELIRALDAELAGVSRYAGRR